jgi:hypothetical protein
MGRPRGRCALWLIVLANAGATVVLLRSTGILAWLRGSWSDRIHQSRSRPGKVLPPMRAVSYDRVAREFRKVVRSIEPFTLLLCLKPRSVSCYRVVRTLNIMNGAQKVPVRLTLVVFGESDEVQRYLEESPYPELETVGMSSAREWFVGEHPLAIFVGADGRIAQRGEVKDLFALGRFIEACQVPSLWRWFCQQPHHLPGVGQIAAFDDTSGDIAPGAPHLGPKSVPNN